MEASVFKDRITLIAVFISGILLAYVLLSLNEHHSLGGPGHPPYSIGLLGTPLRNDGLKDWPVTVKERPFLRPDIKGESLAALHQALDAKLQGRTEKAHKLFQHALALDPNHVEALTEYGEFIEEEDVVKADHLYTCALTINASHTRALVNVKRTSLIVQDIDNKMLERIETKQEQFLKVPSHHPALDRVKKELYYLHIYHTTAIEGNTMTLEQVRHVMETGMAVPGKSIMEHNEIIGLSAALKYINQTMSNRFGSLTIRDIQEIHRRVIGNVDPIEAGHFRTNQVFVGDHIPAPPSDLEELMVEFINWLNSDEALDLHPIELAALAHYKLVHIHPFVDGNGRTSRLLMNVILMQAGYPPIDIKVSERHEYYTAIKTGNQGDIRPFIRFIAKCTEGMLDTYLWLYSDTSNSTLPEIEDGKTIILGPS
ncbi:protein adenylyltransferase FICD-like [Anneissia japonica]|uniref:protein adenylyltransferase FICD-like n=1 Tax=Anneissia japonica TaxID=1529436 RepID=UPI00142570A8|nr:protein adenylyltransferase FICD-like [Anneissia japonica]